jgi:hypothetical protein
VPLASVSQCLVLYFVAGLTYPQNVVLSVHKNSEILRLVKIKGKYILSQSLVPTAPLPFLNSSARTIKTGNLKEK